MQPTEIQVQRCLQVLEAQPESAVYRPEGWVSRDTSVPPGLIELLTDTPALRLQAVADARMRIAGGEQPSADDLAGRMVGRLVCDRIR